MFENKSSKECLARRRRKNLPAKVQGEATELFQIFHYWISEKLSPFIIDMPTAGFEFVQK